MKRFMISSLTLLVCLSFGCSRAYYAGMEKLGIDKRDILVDRVDNAKEAQEDAKEQFASALERYKTVIAFDGGDLEDKYQTLHDTYETSEARAQEVRDRISSIEDVAEALFEEWTSEIKEYSNPKLRRSSKKQLTATKRRYTTLIRAMKKASAKMSPVLGAFKDQVLYLKHNLNAQAVAALEGELQTIRTDVAALIKEMEKSIDEANDFIKTLK